MRILSCVALTVAAAAVTVGTAYAQFGGPDSRYHPQDVTNLVEKVHSDLDAGYTHWHLADADRDRLNGAEKKLRGFAKDWEKAKFDKGDLDDSIGSIQHVLDNNHLEGAERDALSDDVSQLRRMREAYDHHEIGRW